MGRSFIWPYKWINGSLVKLLTLPTILLSLGLFAFVVNAAILMLTARLSDALDVKDFWSGLGVSLVISVVIAITKQCIKNKKINKISLKI